MIDIVVPQVGEATSEVVLARWLKEPGDRVCKGEPLFEVDTDKYVVEIEAFETGTLEEVLVPAGAEVMPLQVVARLVPEGGDPDQPSSPEPAAADRARVAAEPTPSVLASPKARRTAAELGVPIETLAGKGTGPDGLITAEDVEAASEEPRRSGPQGARRPLTGPRRVIAERTVASKREVPHFYLWVDADMYEAGRLREQCTGELGWERPPSITDLLVAACGRALSALPEANVSYVDGTLVQRGRADVGIAVSLDDGVVVPVLRDVGERDLESVSLELRALLERARTRRLRDGDLDDRSLVVSNLGMHGVDGFAAIIDLPDPMILAVGRLADRCVPVEGAPGVRPMCTLSLSVDHRAFDGVLGARFLSSVRQRLEDPWDLLHG